ncbi:MAG: carbohydrate ABC transporter permease [Treponema sp.]|nr:carbohydrate ABC transporter permease [Treponema sp.]
MSNYQYAKNIRYTAAGVAAVTGIYAVLFLVAFLCAGPFLWLLSTSFKANENIYTLSLLPERFSLDNYFGVFALLNIGRMLMNSVIIAAGGVTLNALMGSLCAYPLAKMDFFGKKTINTALVATMIIPAAAGLVVNYITISRFHLRGNFLGVIIPNSVNVFSIILLRQAYLSIPKEMMDSARIDGARELLIWRSIMLPQILPTIATVVIMDFINKWNQFLWPLLVLNVDQYPVATGLKHISGQFNYKFTNVAAGTVLSVIPVIIIFISFQKYYVNTTMGALKG